MFAVLVCLSLLPFRSESVIRLGSHALSNGGTSVGPIPIPSSPVGFSRGSSSAKVILEAFFDLQCPDSKASNPTVNQLLSEYPQDSFSLVVHLFPLPYHRNAFYASQAANVIRHYSPRTGLVFDWFDAYFAAQDNFTNAVTSHLSSDQVMLKMSSLAEESIGVPKHLVYMGLQYGNEFDEDTRVAWKYGCSRTVSGTPFFFVNGVYVNNDPSWTVEDWKKLLNPLF